jgi:hypothetical protein
MQKKAAQVAEAGGNFACDPAVRAQFEAFVAGFMFSGDGSNGDTYRADELDALADYDLVKAFRRSFYIPKEKW